MKRLLSLCACMVLAGCSSTLNRTVVAHRGASAYAPENTLSSFQLAWELGTDAIEGDFYLTTDGEIVCIHDSNIKRYTGIDREVADSTLQELRAMDFGSWIDEKWRGETLPTLQEVLATVPSGKRIFVEIKCGVEIVPRLLEAVGASGLEEDQVVFICFKSEVIGAIKKAAPQYVANWLTVVKKGKDGSLDPEPDEILRTLRDCHADGISVKANEAVSADLVEAIKSRGYGFHVWTVDSGRKARRLAKMGADSITTNKPDVIARSLR